MDWVGLARSNKLECHNGTGLGPGRLRTDFNTRLPPFERLFGEYRIFFFLRSDCSTERLVLYSLYWPVQTFWHTFIRGVQSHSSTAQLFHLLASHSGQQR